MDAFKKDLDKSFSNRNLYEYKHFPDTFISSLNKYAPIKKKIYFRFSSNSFMIKALRKPTMHKSKFKNVYHKI